MKTELRLTAHTVIGGAQVIEIWHDGRFIGQVTGADGPGLRVVSKYAMSHAESKRVGAPSVSEVHIDPTREG